MNGRAESLDELGRAPSVPAACEDHRDRASGRQSLDFGSRDKRVEEDEGVARLERVRADLALPPVRPSLLRCPSRMIVGPDN